MQLFQNIILILLAIKIIDAHLGNIAESINKIFYFKKVLVVFQNNSDVERYNISHWNFQKTLFNVYKPVILKTEKFKNYLIIVENELHMNIVLEKLNSSKYRNEKANYAILTTSKHKDTIERYFATLWKYRIIHNVIIMKNKKNTDLFQANPYGENNCFKTMKFKKITITNNLFTVAKLLSGCSLTFLRMSIKMLGMPYYGEKCFDCGIVDKIILSLGYMLNFTANHVDSTIEMENVLQFNFTESIHHRNLSHIDVIYISNRYEAFYALYDISNVLFYDTVNWIVAQTKLLPHRELLTKIFSMETWGYILASLVACAMILLMQKIPLVSSVFVTIGLALSQVYFADDNTIVYLFVQIFQLMFFILCCTFQSKLISVLFTPYFQEGITSLEDLVLQNYSIILFPYMAEQFLATNYPILHKFAENTIPIAENLVDRAAKMNKGKFASSAYNLGLKYTNFINNTVKSLGARYMISYEPAFLFKNGPPVVESIDKVLQIMLEGGFIDKIQSDIIYKQHSGSVTNSPLLLEHFEFGFIILCVGYASGVVIFVLEILGKFVLDRFIYK